MQNKPFLPSTRSLRRNFLHPATGILFMLFLALLSGCSKTPVPEPENALPSAASMKGWTIVKDAQTYDRKTLFDYMDGASEYYFTYSFEKMATGQYRNTAGLELIVEVWRLSNSSDAYGLFSGHSGASMISVGHANEASLESGSRLYFWQDRFYVVLTATTTLSDNDLISVAQLISNRLPAGGARPALVGRLPTDQRVAGSAIFFHEELAIQDQLWLGGENLLGLDKDTNAVFALYQIGPEQVKLLLVQFPDSQRAAAGLEGLTGGGLDGLAASRAEGALLGAVFGNTTSAQAEALLARVLGK
jgi:hypothetical protein